MTLSNKAVVKIKELIYLKCLQLSLETIAAISRSSA